MGPTIDWSPSHLLHQLVRWIVRLQGSPDKRVLVRERNLQLVGGLKSEDRVNSE